MERGVMPLECRVNVLIKSNLKKLDESATSKIILIYFEIHKFDIAQNTVSLLKLIINLCELK